MPQINLKSPGQPVADFSVSGCTVTVAGLAIDCEARQEDSTVHIEVREHSGAAVEGGNKGPYLATISIPPREYEETSAEAEDGESTERLALPLDHNAIVVTLWPTV